VAPRVTDVTTSAVTLEWDVVMTATKYDLLAEDMSGSSYNVSTMMPVGTVSGLMPGTVYSIKVVAINDNLRSMEGNVTSQVTSACQKYFSYFSVDVSVFLNCNRRFLFLSFTLKSRH